MRPCHVVLLAIAICLSVFACAEIENSDRGDFGWQWTGEGQTRNFAAAEADCRRAVTELHRLERRAASDRVSRNSLPDPFRSRQTYWQCMRREGWEIVRQ